MDSNYIKFNIWNLGLDEVEKKQIIFSLIFVVYKNLGSIRTGKNQTLKSNITQIERV